MDNLNKLLLIDSEYYNPNCNYVNFLKKYNIKTIEQILDDNFNEISKYCNINTKTQLYGLISMLRYRFYNEPLYCEYLLDKEIDFNSMRHSLYLGLSIPLEENLSFSPVKYLGCPNNISELIINELLNKDIRFLLRDDPKLINYLKLILEKEVYKQIYPVINTYIEIYENNKNKRLNK